MAESRKPTEYPWVLNVLGLCFVLLSLDHTDDKKCRNGKNRGEEETNDGVGNKACNEERYKRDCRNGDGIGELGGNVVNVVAVCARRCHDGGVGDGRAVVAANRTCKTSGDTNEEKFLMTFCKYVENDRNEDTERTPRRTCGERKHASNEEYDSGKKCRKLRRKFCHGLFYERGEVEKTGYVFKTCRKGQDKDRGNHCDKALRNALHSLFKGNEATDDEVCDGDDKRDQSTPRQANGRVGICESGNEVNAFKELTNIKKTDDTRDNENDHGDDEVEKADFVLFGCVDGGFFYDGSIQSAEVAVLCLDFKLAHFAVVKAENGKSDNEYERHERIEVERNRADENFDTGICFGINVTRNCSCPRGNGSDHANRCCCCVDDVRELDTGNLMCVGNGGHNGADCETVEIVIDKDEYAEDEGCEHSTHFGFDVFLCPVSECGGRACLIDEGNERAEDHEEDKDACCIRYGCDEGIVYDDVHGSGEAEIGSHECADENADEKGRIYFLGDERETDCNNRRQNRPERICKGEAFAACDIDNGKHHDDNERNCKSNQTFLFTNC